MIKHDWLVDSSKAFGTSPRVMCRYCRCNPNNLLDKLKTEIGEVKVRQLFTSRHYNKIEKLINQYFPCLNQDERIIQDIIE